MILIVTNTDVVHQIQRIEVTTKLMVLVTEAHQRHVELPERPGYWLHDRQASTRSAAPAASTATLDKAGGVSTASARADSGPGHR